MSASSRLRVPGLWAALAGLLALAACQSEPPGALVVTEQGTKIEVPQQPGPALTPIRFDQIHDWKTDRLSEAVPAFRAGCAAMTRPDRNLGGQGTVAALGGSADRWRDVCLAAKLVTPGDDALARAFFETNFQAYILSTDGSAAGMFTGYYEPVARGAWARGGEYQTPLLRKPVGVAPAKLPARAQIVRGALAHKGLEMLWVNDPIDAFFIEIQGSGRVQFTNGEVVRVSYDGQNGKPYVPIGRVLVDRGEMTIDQVSMQSIRAWMEAHPKEAPALMDKNPSYVFFREIRGSGQEEGPPGALGAKLTPMRSIAVDRAFIPLGAPVWIDTKDTLDGKPIRRLMLAQDLGGAIKGQVRADIFFGWTPDAAAHAGKQRGTGNAYILLPKTPATTPMAAN